MAAGKEAAPPRIKRMPKREVNTRNFKQFWNDELQEIEARYVKPFQERRGDSNWYVVDFYSRHHGGLVFRLWHCTQGFVGNLFTFSDRSARALRAVLNGWV